MADKEVSSGFTRLPTNSPLIRMQPTPSGAEGEQALSEVFGKIGKASIEKSIEINNEISNASLYQTSNQLYRLQQSAEIEISQNPEQAKMLVDTAKATATRIMNQAPMNNSDRRKLDHMAEKQLTDIEFKGAKASIQLAKTQALISFSSQWSEQLQQIQDSFNDEKRLEDSVNVGKKLLDEGLRKQWLSEHQYNTYVNSLHEALRRAQNVHAMYQNEEMHTARNYHKANSKIHSVSSLHKVGMPIEESTDYLYADRMKQFDKADVSAAIVNGTPLNWQLISSLPEHQQQELSMELEAVNHVKAIVDSGGSYAELEMLHDQLNAKGTTLNSAQRAQKQYLDNLFEKYKNNKFLSQISSTPLGSQITNDHHMNIKAIESNTAMDDNQKAIAIRQYDNQYVSQAVAAGLATHTPTNLIQPIRDTEIAKAQSSFEFGADPSNLINTMDYYDKSNRIYVARGLEKPIHREVAYTVGMMEGSTNHAKRMDLIAANQKGIDWSPLSVKDGTNEPKVRGQVTASLDKKMLNYLSRLDTDRSNSMVEMTVNAVRYDGMKNRDYQLNDYKSYISDWNKEYTKQYDIKSGSYYAFNKKQIPGLNDHEWELLANYARDQGYEAMKSAPGRSNVDFRQSIDQNPLYVTITPDNFIVVMGSIGGKQDVVYSHFYDPRMLSVAKQHAPKSPNISAESIQAAKEEASRRGMFK